MTPLTEWRPLLDWLYRRLISFFHVHPFIAFILVTVMSRFTICRCQSFICLTIPHCSISDIQSPAKFLMTFSALAGFGVSSSICWRPSLVLYVSPPYARESQACLILPIVSAALQVPWYTQVKLSLTWHPQCKSLFIGGPSLEQVCYIAHLHICFTS